ncbi:MAG: hypothetical protein M1823_000331 [Watsoniomyces obsoletus]|nr:MAG: hypothetical protein M1823_000331 [Watsoniomyces obsoletus]
MSTTPILSDRDINAPVGTTTSNEAKDGSSNTNNINKPGASSSSTLEYHRQVLQSKLSDDKSNQQYISPSDNIMSPCTAKLSAYRSKHFKAKPQSLFGKATSNGAKGSGVNGSPSSSQNSSVTMGETKDVGAGIESGTDDDDGNSRVEVEASFGGSPGQ